MYRAITWAALEAGVNPDDAAAIAAFIGRPPVIASGTDPDHPTITVDGIDVGEPIRGKRVTDAVSAISAVPEVRTHLVEHQRRYVADSPGGIVVEGRDIGSVVLPDAKVKVFLTADPDVRALRRAAERVDGLDPSLTDTQASLLTRDAKDSSRSVSPLTRADGAIEIDTTHLSFDEVVDAVVSLAARANAP